MNLRDFHQWWLLSSCWMTVWAVCWIEVIDRWDSTWSYWCKVWLISAAVWSVSDWRLNSIVVNWQSRWIVVIIAFCNLLLDLLINCLPELFLLLQLLQFCLDLFVAVMLLKFNCLLEALSSWTVDWIILVLLSGGLALFVIQLLDQSRGCWCQATGPFW